MKPFQQLLRKHLRRSLGLILLIGLVSYQIVSISQTSTTSVSVVSGWNLLGNGTNTAIDPTSVAPLQSSNVTSLWKWDATNQKWGFYTPTQSDGGASYAASKGYTYLSVINPGEGFWVDTNQATSLQIPNATSYSSTNLQVGSTTALNSGWNLISVGDSISPCSLNLEMSATPPTTGQVPINITSLWAWDPSSSKWFFYAPSLDAAGTNASYASQHNYLDFSTNNKLLGFGTGFWVNMPTTSSSVSGSVNCTSSSGSSSSVSTVTMNSALTQVTNYQNADLSSQVFNTQVADLNGDGLEDVVVSGWAAEPVGYTQSPHGKIPVKILIQQKDGTLSDQTTALLGAGNNMIWGSQRIIIQDFDGDGKPDIFLGGFQDSGQNCCSPTTSVMFWNEGTAFTRYDFSDTVWAHAVCVDDLYGTGHPDIIMGGTNTYNSDIYVNNGGRSFTMTHLPQYINSGGACTVVHDATTGNIGIITTNIYPLVPGYNAVIQVFDHNMNFLNAVGLPGAETTSAAHDIVNIINTDINGDGKNDLILTDNGNDSSTGHFTALINQGGLSFLDQTNTYFPTQKNNYYFQYYTRTLSINGTLALFVDNVNSNWNFSTLPDLWELTNGSFQPTSQPQLSTDIGSYLQPTLYKDANGNLRLLLIHENNILTFTFYTKPL